MSHNLAASLGIYVEFFLLLFFSFKIFFFKDSNTSRFINSTLYAIQIQIIDSPPAKSPLLSDKIIIIVSNHNVVVVYEAA